MKKSAAFQSMITAPITNIAAAETNSTPILNDPAGREYDVEDVAVILAPSTPVDPVDPVTPVDPVDPVTPVDPVDPVDPVTPVGPITFFDDREQRQPTNAINGIDDKQFERILQIDPIFTGTDEQGSNVTINLYNQVGGLDYVRNIVADTGGHWIAIFPRVELDDVEDDFHSFHSKSVLFDGNLLCIVQYVSYAAWRQGMLEIHLILHS